MKKFSKKYFTAPNFNLKSGRGRPGLSRTTIPIPRLVKLKISVNSIITLLRSRSKLV
jgi:hypothetical protein